jgi:mono/diheme cytochrome c family protein
MKLPIFALSLAAVVFAQSPGSPDNGKKLFEKYGCYSCHGHQGQGSSAGPRLAPRPLAAAALIAYVRHPSGQMPPYTNKVIKDSELTDIRAYLASIAEPPPVKNIPLLNQ